MLCGFPSVDYHLLFLSWRFSWISTATATASNTSTCSFPRGRVHEQVSQQYDFFFNKLCVRPKRIEICILSKLQIFKKCRLGCNGGGQEPVSNRQFHQRTYRWHSVPVPKPTKIRLPIPLYNTSENKQAATWLWPNSAFGLNPNTFFPFFYFLPFCSAPRSICPVARDRWHFLTLCRKRFDTVLIAIYCWYLA